MTSIELKDYLEKVVDAEKNIYLQNRTIEKLKAIMGELGVESVIVQPVTPKEPEQNNGGYIVYVFMIVFGIILAIVGFNWLINGNVLFFLFQIMVFLSGCIMILITICLGFSEVGENERLSMQYERDRNCYEEEYRKYKKEVELDKIRVSKELKVREFVGLEIERLEKTREITFERLNSLYNQNIIFPKYRNLIAVCSLLEYISSGLCSELEGHEGAYNLYEMYFRMDRIIIQLDMVLSNLEQIKGQQYMLYSAIQDANAKVNLLIDSTNKLSDTVSKLSTTINTNGEEITEKISQLQKTSEVEVYCSKQIGKELNYMNRMNYKSGFYENSLFDAPPLW